jgi:hypothetical protein
VDLCGVGTPDWAEKNRFGGGFDQLWWTPESLEAKPPRRESTCPRVLGPATQEFKAEAVQLACSSPERSMRQLAYEL